MEDQTCPLSFSDLTVFPPLPGGSHRSHDVLLHTYTYGGPGLVLVLVVSHLSQSRQRRTFCLNIYRENSNWWGPIENGKYPSLVVVVGLKMEIFDIF